MTHAESHDSYLASRPEEQRAALSVLRSQIRDLIPEAEEVISYGMPGFRIGKAVIAGYAGFARHCGYYPHSGGIIPHLRDELDAGGFRYTPGAVQFTPGHPLPQPLVARLVTLRLAEAFS